MGRGQKKKAGKGSQGQNRKNSQDFLDRNRKKEGVKVNPSGLQYQFIEAGEERGDKPGEESTVTIEQRILLIDGTVVRDTYHEVGSEKFSLKEAIEGLKEAIPMMTKGSRWKFFVPPELAWGKKGAGEKIGPYTTLIFDIKLVDFQ